MDLREKLIDLSAQRTSCLDAANAAMEAKDTAAYDAAMEKVTNLNEEIRRQTDLVRENERKLDLQAPSAAEVRDKAEERAHLLQSGESITFTQDELRRMIRNDVTLATGTLVEPTGVDTRIHGPLGNVPSSIIDRVQVMDLTGMGAFQVPYAVSDLVANGGKVRTLAGTTRASGGDPVFNYSIIKPYEVNVTQYVDINIGRLTPVAYNAYIETMAMRALRRKVATLIVNGDGQSTPDMFGIKNAKNKDGQAITATVNVSAIDENTLDTLFYAYGSDEAVGENAWLFLNKADLKAFGTLRNDGLEKVYTLKHTSANEGTIDDSGSVTPYGIMKDLTALSGAAAGSAAIQTMIYGDPMNYMLGLFGPYSIRVDTSYKAAERMHTILGDVFVGGNVIVHNGFAVATLPKTGS